MENPATVHLHEGAGLGVRQMRYSPQAQNLGAPKHPVTKINNTNAIFKKIQNQCKKIHDEQNMKI